MAAGFHEKSGLAGMVSGTRVSVSESVQMVAGCKINMYLQQAVCILSICSYSVSLG